MEYLQIKSKLRFSQSDSVFHDLINDSFMTFAGKTTYPFSQENDSIIICIGTYSEALDEHLQPILEWAKTSLDSENF
jgi:hypothetical protein